VSSGAGHWRTKPNWVRAAVFDLALALPGAGYRTMANCFNLQQLAVRGHTTADSLPITMETLGKPQAIRSDNNAVFKTTYYTTRSSSLAARRQNTITYKPENYSVLNTFITI
jgi:hypothetical protein